MQQMTMIVSHSIFVVTVYIMHVDYLVVWSKKTLPTSSTKHLVSITSKLQLFIESDGMA